MTYTQEIAHLKPLILIGSWLIAFLTVGYNFYFTTTFLQMPSTR